MFKNINKEEVIKTLDIKPSIIFTTEEYETIINVDKECIIIYTNIKSHINKLLDKDYLTFVRACSCDEYLVSVTYKMPNNYLHVSIQEDKRANDYLYSVIS